MKNFSQIFVCLFALCFCFTTDLSAQTFRASTPNSTNRTVLKKKPTGEKTKFIPSSNLKEGKNYIRLGTTKLEIIKKRGRVVSVKSISNTGQMGPNTLSNGNQTQAFWCIGNICGCSGDNDCNNMFTSNVCSPDMDDAVCVDDNCYCVMD